MLKVFKYPVLANNFTDVFALTLPEGAKPLHFAVQDGKVCLWALVDPDPNRATSVVMFRMAGTGHPIDTVGRYINTMIMQEGRLVFHFFFA